MTYNQAVAIAIIVYTPVIMLVSYLLDRFMDAPLRNWTAEMDQQIRVKSKSVKDFCKFFCQNKTFWILAAWTLLIFLITLIFGITEDERKQNRSNKECGYVNFFDFFVPESGE